MSDPEVLKTIVSLFSPEEKVGIGKWLKKPCVQTQNKVFGALWGRDLSLKLGEEAQAQALQINGVHLWDPSTKRQPKPEWVHIPFNQSSHWKQYARLAYEYVSPRPTSND